MITRKLKSLAGALGLSAIMLYGALPAKDREVSRPYKQYTIEQFMATTSVQGASFSPDETQILLSSNGSGIFNAYSVPVTGGALVAISKSNAESTYAVSYFPDDLRIMYTHDQGGNENNHLYVLDRSGTEKDLTPGEKLKAQFAGWTHDGKAFFLLTNERDARFFDVYRVDATSYERRLIYKDDVGYQLGSVSNDERWMAFSKSNTTSDSDIFLYDTRSRQMRTISPHSGVAEYRVAAFDADSRWLYYITNDSEEFLRVRRYDLQSRKHEEVEKDPWDVVFTYFSFNGKYRITGINDDGRTVIKIRESRNGKPVSLPSLPDGEISDVSISRSEKRMAFYLNGDRSPNNLYAYDFETRKATRVTDSLTKDIDPLDLVESTVVRFKSFDGLTIPSIFYRPHQATPEQKAPALVWVHGGPGGQTRKGYTDLIQYLVNHGYVVLGINNRGSSGYGKSFNIADDQKHGREPLWDCVEGKRYLATLPYVDSSRIGIIGESYGGYMTLAALAFKPDDFTAGVDIFGVSNWLRTLESMPKYWESFRLALYKEMGDPDKDREMLKEISPLFHADKIRKPLLVLQGANDPRVIKSESDDIVAAVRRNGVPVEYVVFPDEGHGFSKKKNQIDGSRAILQFLDKHLNMSQGQNGN